MNAIDITTLLEYLSHSSSGRSAVAAYARPCADGRAAGSRAADTLRAGAEDEGDADYKPDSDGIEREGDE